jgi:hypothetical protein
MVSLKLLCSSAADYDLVDAWLSVRGLFIAWEAIRSKGRPIGPRKGLSRPAWAQFGPSRGLLRPVLLPASSRCSPLLHLGPWRRFLSELDSIPCLARFSTFLVQSSEFIIFSGLVLGLLESCSLHCLTCIRLQGLVMRCLMNLSRKSCFQR